MVDCPLVAFFLEFGKNSPQWPCWPWRLQFWDGSTRNHTDSIGWINLLEFKLNSDVTSFLIYFCCCWNPSAKRHGRWQRQSTRGEFVVCCRLQYVPHVDQNWLRSCIRLEGARNWILNICQQEFRLKLLPRARRHVMNQFTYQWTY
jgi:hypothetical protein